MLKRLSLLLFALLSVCIFTIDQAQAGRRGVRVDIGAWNPAEEISLGGGSGACPEAGWDGEIPVPGPGPTIFWDWVNWNGLEFRTSGFEGLSIFNCQTSRSYTPGAQPEEYLNQAIFPPDEADLAVFIGTNTNNAVTAIRYSFLGDHPSGYYGRQWTFYFFPGDLTVVALHGVQDGQSTYEWIYDHDNGFYIWDAQVDAWYGEYFCFQGNSYIGDCVPPAPEYRFEDGFE